MSEKIGGILWKIFLAVYAVIMIVILVLCIMETQDKIPAKMMVVYPLIGLLAFSVIAFFSTKLNGFLEKYEKILLPLFFLGYTLLIVRLTTHSRGILVNDSGSLVFGANYMAGLSEEMNWNYFGRWNHNIMPMIFLSIVFRVAKFVGMSDVYYLALALNILQVLAVLYCVFRLAKRYSKYGSAAAWLGMGMMACYVPIFGHTQSLYTDAFSFGFGIIAFYVWLNNYEKRKTGWKFWCFNILAGLIWAIGLEIKATSAISFIALLVYFLLFVNRKEAVRNLIGLMSPILIVSAICSAYINSLPSEDYADTWGVPPISYFIGIGLEGNGGFDAYSDYFVGVTDTYGMEAKKEFSRKFILEHLDRFVDAEHMISKLRHNFASGAMKADDFLWEVEHPGFVYNCISYNGAYWKTFRIGVTAYWYMLLWFLVIGCVFRFVRKKGDKEKPEIFVPIMTVFGIMLYVMIAEANNRQMYNQLPFIFSAANIGIWTLQERIESIIRNRKRAEEA